VRADLVNTMGGPHSWVGSASQATPRNSW